MLKPASAQSHAELWIPQKALLSPPVVKYSKALALNRFLFADFFFATWLFKSVKICRTRAVDTNLNINNAQQ